MPFILFYIAASSEATYIQHFNFDELNDILVLKKIFQLHRTSVSQNIISMDIQLSII